MAIVGRVVPAGILREAGHINPASATCTPDAKSVAAHAGEPGQAIYEAIQAAVTALTEGAPRGDDITVLVLEYAERGL